MDLNESPPLLFEGEQARQEQAKQQQQQQQQQEEAAEGTGKYAEEHQILGSSPDLRRQAQPQSSSSPGRQQVEKEEPIFIED
jgi:hypothetical protein